MVVVAPIVKMVDLRTIMLSLLALLVCRIAPNVLDPREVTAIEAAVA